MPDRTLCGWTERPTGGLISRPLSRVAAFTSEARRRRGSAVVGVLLEPVDVEVHRLGGLSTPLRGGLGAEPHLLPRHTRSNGLGHRAVEQVLNAARRPPHPEGVPGGEVTG